MNLLNKNLYLLIALNLKKLWKHLKSFKNTKKMGKKKLSNKMMMILELWLVQNNNRKIKSRKKFNLITLLNNVKNIMQKNIKKSLKGSNIIIGLDIWINKINLSNNNIQDLQIFKKRITGNYIKKYKYKKLLQANRSDKFLLL